MCRQWRGGDARGVLGEGEGDVDLVGGNQRGCMLFALTKTKKVL